MRTLFKGVAFFVGAFLLFITCGLLWFFFYSGDLPDTSRLRLFAPESSAQVTDPCLNAIATAVPYDSIGANLRTALQSVGVSESDPGVLVTIFRGFTGGARPPRATLSYEVSRTLFCEAPSGMLRRHVAEIRTVVLLERRFSRRDLFTIYVNRAYFGEGMVGIRSASLRLFRKEPAELTIPEAAMISGLISAPSRDSPIRHRDRALRRRNDVLDAMYAMGAISAKESEDAKATDLGIANAP